MATKIHSQIKSTPPKQTDVAQGTTGGIGKANCDLTGGALDAVRTALMNAWVAQLAPLGLKVIVSINSFLNIYCGALQTIQGLAFIWVAAKTRWVWGTLFGSTRVGCGLTLFAGGVLTLIQSIGEVLLVLGKAVATKATHLKEVMKTAGMSAPFAYIGMFVILIGMGGLFLFKACGIRKLLNANGLEGVQTEVGTSGERFKHRFKNLISSIGFGEHTELSESDLYTPENKLKANTSVA